MSRNKLVGILSALARFMAAPEWSEGSDLTSSRVPARIPAALIAKKESYIAFMSFQRWHL